MKLPFRATLLLTAFASLLAAEAPIPGLAVGENAPSFVLSDSTGQDVSLAGLLGEGPVALVFVRSADWCPHCRRQLSALEAARAEVESSGGRIVALSYDEVKTNAMAVDKLGLTYPLLSDVGSSVIDLFGIRNTEARGRASGVPHPVVFVVDADGVIRDKLHRESYRDRPESAEIAAAFARL